MDVESRPASLEDEALSRVQGLRYLRGLKPLLGRLRDVGCHRDRSGNRRLFFDNLCSLILLTFYDPSLKTLNDLGRASRLANVRKRLGCQATNVSSLSEAMSVFESEHLVEIIQQLLARIPHSPGADPRLKELSHIPTAVDGTLLLHLPQITQACYNTRRDRGWKLHTHFEVLRGTPTAARVTDASGKGSANEKAVLRSMLEADRCYITDRGYEEFALFNAIVAVGSSYVCRVRNDHHFQPDESQKAPDLSEEARSAGVLSDEIGRMGSTKSKRIEHPDHLQRRITVRITTHPKRGGRRRRAASQDIVLVTNLLDVPAEIIVLLYRFRWLIELFFRWVKCVLSCRHLVSHKENGVQIQMYCAIIACLLIQLTIGSDIKATQWTYKLLCLFCNGWATEEEVLDHLHELRQAAAKKSK